MVRDYSDRKFAQERLKPRGDTGGRKNDGSQWLRRVTGVVFAMAALLGVGGSFLLNWSINRGIAALSRERAVNERLIGVNKSLREKRDALMDQKRIENAAAKLGLQPPNAKQVRRP